MTIEAQAQTIAMFASTDEALIYAFNYADQQFARGVMARLYKQSGETGKGLIGLDGAGEAGMIMADIRRLTEQTHQDILCISYTKVVKQCHCCGSNMQTDEVMAALSRIECWLLQYAFPREIKKSTEDDNREAKSFKKKNRLKVNAEYSDDEKNKILNTINLSLVRSVIYDFFGLKPIGTVKLLAELEGVHRNTASKYQEWIKRALRKLKKEAYNKIDQALRESGKVGMANE